jgi:hypothetical protein
MLNWLWRALEKGTCGVRYRPQPSLHNTRLIFQTKSDVGKTSSRLATCMFDMFWQFFFNVKISQLTVPWALVQANTRHWDMRRPLTPTDALRHPSRPWQMHWPKQMPNGFCYRLRRWAGMWEATQYSHYIHICSHILNIIYSLSVHWVGHGWAAW